MWFLGFNRVGTAAHILGTGRRDATREDGPTAGAVLLALLVLNIVGMIAIVAISAVR